MLQVTPQAVTMLKEARSQRGVPEHFGLRVEAPRSGGTGKLQLAFAEGPLEGDEVGEANGLRLFVSGDVAEPLAEQAIDAQDTPSGVELVLRDQREGLT